MGVLEAAPFQGSGPARVVAWDLENWAYSGKIPIDGFGDFSGSPPRHLGHFLSRGAQLIPSPGFRLGKEVGKEGEVKGWSA